MGWLKNKKGLVARQIVIMVLLIVGFVILLVAFFSIDWELQGDREVCHLSVISRATFRLSGSTSFIPLECRTQKICITAKNFGRGNCDEFLGEENVITKRVSNGEKGKTQIEQLIAREMVDCWTMMGEGEVSLFSRFWANDFGFGSVYPSCVMCSRLAFDEQSLGKADIPIGDIDPSRYMATHKVSGTDESYLQFLSGKASADDFEIVNLNEEEIEEDVNNLKNALENSGEEFYQSQAESVDTDALTADLGQLSNIEKTDVETGRIGEAGVLFMQISSPTHLGSLTRLTGAGLGGSVLLRRIPGVGKLSLGTPLGRWIAGIAVSAVSVGQQANIFVQRSYTAGKCGDIEVGSEARNGCSAVRLVDYKQEDISQYCSVIEST